MASIHPKSRLEVTNWLSRLRFHMSDHKTRIQWILGENNGSGVRKHLENLPKYIPMQLPNPNPGEKQ